MISAAARSQIDRTGGIEMHAKRLRIGIFARIDRVLHDDLDRQNEPGDHGQCRDKRHQIGAQHRNQGSSSDQRAVLHQKPGDSSGCKHHDRDEKQAEIKLPNRGEVAQRERKVGHKNRANDRADEKSDPADVGREQNDAGLHCAKIGGIRDLEIDRGQRARDTGEETGKAKSQKANDMRIVAHKLHALGIVANGIAHSAKRRTRQGIHRDHREQRPECNQIIDLNLRPEVPVEHAQELGAVSGDAGFAAEEATQDERGGGD